MLGRLFGKTVASRRGLGGEDEDEREREREREMEMENTNNQNLPFGNYVDEEKRDTNQDLPFGQYVDAQDAQTHGFEGVAVERPQYARTVSDSDEDVGRQSDDGYSHYWPTPVVADELMITVVQSVLIFNLLLFFFIPLMTFGFLVTPESYEDGIFLANFTNGTGSDFVIEVNQPFVDAINRALFPVMVFPSVPLILCLSGLYDKNLPFDENERDLDGLPCWAVLVIVALSLGSPGSAVALIFTGNLPDFVAAFNIPETWFFPGNEKAATSLGLALSSIILVCVFGICCTCFQLLFLDRD